MTDYPAHRFRAFVDTAAYFALSSPTDRNHPAARLIAQRLQQGRWRLFTTNFTVAETHALLLSRMNRQIAFQVLERIDASPTTIVRVTEADEQRARTIIRQYQDKNFSLTDAISFVVMERLAISHAFTFDRNFSQYGLTMLTPALL